MECDMCGKKGKLFVTLLEGTEMKLCQDCTKFGKTLRTVQNPSLKLSKHSSSSSTIPSRISSSLSQDEKIEVLVEEYAELIKNKREKLGLRQEDLAKKLAERLSLIQKIESGHFEPSLVLARKLEKCLGLVLIQQHTESYEGKKRTSSIVLTIGDMINLKKKS